MQKGRIIEQGNHEFLLSRHPDGLYSKFVKEQEQSEVADAQNSGQNNTTPQLIEEDEPIKRTSFNLKTSAVGRELEKTEKAMKKKYDEIDEVKEKEMEETMDKIKKGNHLSRMMSISKPTWMIFYATFVSIC